MQDFKSRAVEENGNAESKIKAEVFPHMTFTV